MFNHQNGAPGGHFFDELRDAVDIFMAHALCGLVEQHQLGLHRQRGGDLECAFSAIGQIDRDLVGHVFQAHFGQQLHGLVIELAQAAFAAPEMERCAELALQAQAHVFQKREVGKHRRDLERADHAPPRDLRRTLACDVMPVEPDDTRRGFEELGQQVETRGLARAVGTNQRMDGAPANRQVHIAHGGKALELFGQAGGFENDVAHCALAAPLGAQ